MSDASRRLRVFFEVVAWDAFAGGYGIDEEPRAVISAQDGSNGGFQL